MKKLHLIVSIVALAMLTGCTSAPVAPSPQQQFVASAVEDLLSIGLVPVLSKNASYLPAAQSIAVALGTFQGATITPADIDAFLSKTALTPQDAKEVAGIVNAAWSVYSKRYAAQVGSSLRPDCKLFLAAVANGINNAIAAVPKSDKTTAQFPSNFRKGETRVAADGVNTETYLGEGCWSSTLIFVRR